MESRWLGRRFSFLLEILFSIGWGTLMVKENSFFYFVEVSVREGFCFRGGRFLVFIRRFSFSFLVVLDKVSRF